jgi:halimadienyl-diphosphate synthase
MTYTDELRDLLAAVGTGYVSTTAYDTAWLARLGEFDGDIANRALRWLCENQLPDGSWGVSQPYNYHDRVISTLSAMIALTHRGRRASDRVQIENGLIALGRITDNATKALTARDDLVATAGFEMIVPTLVFEAERLGIIKQQGDRILGRLGQLRQAKMAKLAGYKISRHITAAYSAEWAGEDGLHLLEAGDLQEGNGSLANSPSATAYFAGYVDPGNKDAMSYLRHVMDSRAGAAPSFAPFDIMERCWVLWNIALADADQDPEIAETCRQHADFLHGQWQKGRGLAFSEQYGLADGDDTSVGFQILSRFGHAPDVEAVLSFEEDNWFRCYKLEATPSVDVNVHVLGALREAGHDRDHPSVKKALNFVRSKRRQDAYWLDKWHTSAYYTASHVIAACSDYDRDLCRDSINWMLATQQADGSWGFHGFATAEETAYCLQALCIWKRRGGKVPAGRIEQGHFWLEKNSYPPYPPLWTAKSLYCPELMVRSAIASALILCESVD